jgi:hypothetical protein
MYVGHNHVVQRHSAVLNKVVVQKSVAVTNQDGSITHVQTDPQATVVSKDCHILTSFRMTVKVRLTHTIITPQHLVIGTGGATFTKTAV